MDNTQLPAEVVEEIKNGAQATLTRASTDLKYSAGYYDGYTIGATEYATKLHEAQQEIKSLKGSIETHKRSYDARSKDYDELDEKFEIAEELLKKFICRHEAGLLPDRGIYNEIKTFLDGTRA